MSCLFCTESTYREIFELCTLSYGSTKFIGLRIIDLSGYLVRVQRIQKSHKLGPNLYFWESEAFKIYNLAKKGTFFKRSII